MSPALEGVAADLLEAAGCEDPPVSALELADCCGLEVRPARLLRARLRGGVIEVNVQARATRLHGLVAHELGHWALQRAGEPDTEDGARYLVGALLLPRVPFDRDLRETGWSLEELRRRHPNASAEVIARRIVQLRDAVASIWDQGRCTARVASSWLPVEHVGRKTSALERRLADRVLETARTEHPAPLVWAVPMFDGAHRRVVVVLEAEQLALRWP
jgi:hypothetical protein